MSDTLLVTLNGQEIRENDELLQFWKTYLEENSGVDPEQYQSIIRQYAMDYTLHYALIEQKMAEAGKTISEEEAKARLQQEWELYVQEIMTSVFGVTEDASDEDKAAAREQAVAYMAMYGGLTEESFLEEMPMARVIMLNEMVQEAVADQATVTDAEVEEYFNALVDEDKDMIGDSAMLYEYYPYYVGREPYFMPEGYRGINHILLEVDAELLQAWQDLTARLEEQNETDTESTETADPEATETEAPEETAEPVTQEMVDAAKQAILDSVQDKVNEIKAKLEAGAVFEDLILEYGTDPGMQDEETRNSGYAVHADSVMWDPDFTAGAMKLEKVGDVSEPVLGQSGVHILHYLRDIPGGAVELTDELKAELREALENEKYNTAIDELTSAWYDEAEIVWTEEGQPWKIEDQEAAE